MSGIVLAAGPDVPSSAPKVGQRVAAFAIAFYKQGLPDYGGFQEKVLVPGVTATEIPDSISFKEASVLPMAVETAWAGYVGIGLGGDTKIPKGGKQGLLVWGGASSMGSAALQIANILGFTVYVAASEKHHAYLKTLGASEVFDYKDENVVDEIVKKAKEDGLQIKWAYDAVGYQLGSTMEVLSKLKGSDTAVIASAVPLQRAFPNGAPTFEGVEAKFVAPPEGEEARNEYFQYVFNHWLKQKLATGEFVPSPYLKVIEGGLDSINKALDELKAGVSGTKLVLEF